MNIITHLQFGGNVNSPYIKEYLVIGTNTHFFRNDDGFNPTSLARSSLELTVVAPSKKDLFFQEWFFRGSSLNGRIVFEMAEVSSTGDYTGERILEFSDARCISLTDRYDINDGSLRYYDMKLKVGKCVMDGIPFGKGSF